MQAVGACVGAKHAKRETLMMAAPRCCTVETKPPFSQASSCTASRMGAPPTVPCATSGNWLLEWLPQMMTFRTSVTCAPTRSATWEEQHSPKQARPQHPMQAFAWKPLRHRLAAGWGSDHKSGRQS